MNKKLLTAVTTLALTAGVFGTTFAADKPAVKILATGGTIAGSAPSNTQMTGYKAGALGIDGAADEGCGGSERGAGGKHWQSGHDQ